MSEHPLLLYKLLRLGFDRCYSFFRAKHIAPLPDFQDDHSLRWPSKIWAIKKGKTIAAKEMSFLCRFFSQMRIRSKFKPKKPVNEMRG